MNWIIYALIAFFAWGFANLGFKYISEKDPFVMTLFMYVSATVMLISYTLISFTERDFSLNKYAAVAAVMGLGSIVGTVAVIKGTEIAPNPGYVIAIFSSSVIIVTLLSPLIYGSELSLLNLLGVMAVIIGIALLAI
ncbi:MAG: EamA family transporter [Halobacteriota archaeon]|nr:EamA family transporter [Halobacteriota archaeon]